MNENAFENAACIIFAGLSVINADDPATNSRYWLTSLMSVEEV